MRSGSLARSDAYSCLPMQSMYTKCLLWAPAQTFPSWYDAHMNGLTSLRSFFLGLEENLQMLLHLCFCSGAGWAFWNPPKDMQKTRLREVGKKRAPVPNDSRKMPSWDGFGMWKDVRRAEDARIGSLRGWAKLAQHPKDSCDFQLQMNELVKVVSCSGPVWCDNKTKLCERTPGQIDPARFQQILLSVCFFAISILHSYERLSLSTGRIGKSNVSIFDSMSVRVSIAWFQPPTPPKGALSTPFDGVGGMVVWRTSCRHWHLGLGLPPSLGLFMNMCNIAFTPEAMQ